MTAGLQNFALPPLLAGLECTERSGKSATRTPISCLIHQKTEPEAGEAGQGPPWHHFGSHPTHKGYCHSRYHYSTGVM